MTQEKKTECLTLHSDHENENVSTAVLSALIKLGNAPSSPKELANTILKHKLITPSQPSLTTTTTSCISQYLKRVEPVTSKIHYSINSRRTSNVPKQPFKIVKILIGNMECYQLNDDDEIKVLRFIELTQPDDQIAHLKQGYINATHLRKAAVPVLGEGLFDTQKETVVVITNGPVESQGAWVPLHRARELIEEFEIESSAGLTKLLSDNPVDDQQIKKKPLPPPPRKIAPLTKHLTTSELLKSLNIQNLNLSALQHYFPFHHPSSSSSSSLLEEENKKVLPVIIYPLQPTNPAMSISLLDRVVVCTAILKKQEEGIEKEYKLMRRLDNGYINGTQLLIAGGIETERERSMILSFEMSRVRIPNKQSQLFGTWIPSRRAQELAATCSIQHALDDFLDEDIESLFPTPLPISSSRRTSHPQHQIAAVEKEEENEYVINQILNPNTTILKLAEINTSHAPLLGSFINTDHNRHVTVIDKPCIKEKGNDSSEDEETDTDNDVEQVRKEIRQLRDKAIAAMEIGNSMQLDDDLFENHHQSIIQLPLKPHTSKVRRKKRKLKKCKQDKKLSTVEDVFTHTLVNEDEEDEDVDIGGSDNDDDLR